MHRNAINACAIFIGYLIYAFLREYNNFFLEVRKIKKIEEFGTNVPINNKISRQ